MITNQLPFFWRGVNRRQKAGRHRHVLLRCKKLLNLQLKTLYIPLLWGTFCKWYKHVCVLRELPLSKQLVRKLLQSEISPQFPPSNASDTGNFHLANHVARDNSQCALRAQDVFLCQVSVVFPHVFIIHVQHGYFWRLIEIQIHITCTFQDE